MRATNSAILRAASRACSTKSAAYTDYLRTLASKLSHELQTPLAIVKSSLDNLDHQAVPADRAPYLLRARGGAERLGAIVRAMSEASRMERAIGGVEGEDFDLAAVVRGCVESLPAAARAAPVDSDLPVDALAMHGAPELIAQALDKLVDNARSFTPEDGWIRLPACDRRRRTISVANSGPPLPPTMQDRLFDSLVSVRAVSAASPAIRCPAAWTRRIWALGLHIVRLIAELHRGRRRHAISTMAAAWNSRSSCAACRGVRSWVESTGWKHGPAKTSAPIVPRRALAIFDALFRLGPRIAK